MTRTRRAVWITLACALALGPSGCLLGSPVAAFSGEPWGMFRDDIDALSGKKAPIWGGNPVAAAIDLPFAFVLDTGLLPISGLIWLIRLPFGGGGHSHGHGDGDHDHDEADHDHDEAPSELAHDDDGHAHGPDTHTHDDGTAHAHDEDSHTDDLTSEAPPTRRRGHHHGDFSFRHHHGDGNYEHVHAERHHHGDGNLEHEHGNGDTQHAHLSDHHHGDHDFDHHHGDAVFDHAHPLDAPNVHPIGSD